MSGHGHAHQQVERREIGSSGGYPVDSPFGSTSVSLSPQVTGPVPRTSDPKDAPLRGRVSPATTQRARAATTRTSKRIGRRQLVELGHALGVRDWQILTRIAQHGYLTTDQIQRFIFTEHASEDTAIRTTRRVLGRLKRDGLVARLPRRQGGVEGGSAPTTWRLTPAGGRLLQGSSTAPRGRTPSIRYLLHCLAIAEAHLALQDYALAAGDGTVVDVEVEPDAWRTFSGIGGAGRTLKPDLWARITGRDQEGTYRDDWFIEVDLGTESLPTLLKKCQAYVDYYRSGAWHTTRSGAGEPLDASGDVMPRVLWLLNDPRRILQLRRRITAATKRGDLPDDLFVCTTLDRLTEALNQDSNPTEGDRL